MTLNRWQKSWNGYGNETDWPMPDLIIIDGGKGLTQCIYTAHTRRRCYRCASHILGKTDRRGLCRGAIG